MSKNYIVYRSGERQAMIFIERSLEDMDNYINYLEYKLRAARPGSSGNLRMLKIIAEQGGKIIGFYLLGDRQLRRGVEDEGAEPIVNLDEYDQKRGVEGVALVVADEYRGTGVGSELKDYSKTVGADYIWGLQYKELDNLQQWLRRRILAAETPEINITLEDF